MELEVVEVVEVAAAAPHLRRVLAPEERPQRGAALVRTHHGEERIDLLGRLLVRGLCELLHTHARLWRGEREERGVSDLGWR